MIRRTSYNTEPTSLARLSSLTPLPYITPPPAPRPSFSSRLMKSSYLFPKLLSNQMNGIGSNSINSYSNEYCAPKDDERAPTNSSYRSNYNDPAKRIGEPSSGSIVSTTKTIPTSNKKSVRFQDDASTTIHHLSDGPCASDMSTREKSKIWYGPNEYDQFKYDAAKHAGVKIVRYDNEKAGQSHHFVMVGNFDDKDEGGDEQVKIKHPDTNNKKGYYNENEYNDNKSLRRSSSISSTGNMRRSSLTAGSDEDAMACKRGLGYHFSRTRKKSRVVTRSAVVAWQRTLRDNSPLSPATSGNVNNKADNLTIKVKRSNGTTRTTNLDKVDDKFSMMLALISTKCSRVAREEAKWRGDVDYRVAYPERHRGDNVTPHDATSSAAVIDLTRKSDDSNVSNKRSRDDEDYVHLKVADTANDSSDSTSLYSKRQRRSGCRGDRDDPLSPTTIGYLVSGVLQAEV